MCYNLAHMLKGVFNSFVFAFSGLQTVWREERNFRIEFFIGLIVVVFMFIYNFSFIEWCLVILSTVFVLGAEIINTAMEDLCNKIEPNQDPAIGKIKDIMSAFVLVSTLGAVVVGVIVFYHHFYSI